jgi:hypothetical protein
MVPSHTACAENLSGGFNVNAIDIVIVCSFEFGSVKFRTTNECTDHVLHVAFKARQ